MSRFITSRMQCSLENGEVVPKQVICADILHHVNRPESEYLCDPANKAEAMRMGEYAAKIVKVIKFCHPPQAFAKLEMTPQLFRVPQRLSHKTGELRDMYQEVRVAAIDFCAKTSRMKNKPVLGDDEAFNDYIGLLRAFAAIRNVYAHSVAADDLDEKLKGQYNRASALGCHIG